MSERTGRMAAASGGIALALLTMLLGAGITGGGHGWVTPLFFSPAVLVLNPIAFWRVTERHRDRIALDLVLIAVALVLDVWLFLATAKEGFEYFARVAPLNWVWLLFWSAWQVCVAIGIVRFATRSRDGIG